MGNPDLYARKLPLIAVVGIFIAVVAVWAFTPVVISHLYPGLAERGQVGDLFGSINALFSGLALAGVIVALLLQREELELQRREIAANRAELARAATAQEESREALRRTIYAQAYKTAMDIINTDIVREARGIVFRELREIPPEKWSRKQMASAEKVCQMYDSVGIMIRHGMLPVEYIADSWGDSLRQSWKILAPLVQKQREARNSDEFWDDYEWLATEALRFQKPVARSNQDQSAH